MLETLLDKGVLINADIAVSVGDTELLGIRVKAAIASFATAAEYGMAFPEGTNTDRVQEAAGLDPVETPDDTPIQAAESAAETGAAASETDGQTTDDGTPSDGDARAPDGSETVAPDASDDGVN